jgi:hypothetical protein
MSNNYEKLKKVLSEIFQLDQADLDFGIYRIMNQKRGEITQFLERDLLPQVKQAFAAYKPADKSEIKSKLDTLIQQISDAGLNPDVSPKVQELKAQYNAATDFSALENEVFSHLTNFFRRYYDKGDFISQRRYKEGVYAIPYEGEEENSTGQTMTNTMLRHRNTFGITPLSCLREGTFISSLPRQIQRKITSNPQTGMTGASYSATKSP